MMYLNRMRAANRGHAEVSLNNCDSRVYTYACDHCDVVVVVVVVAVVSQL